MPETIRTMLRENGAASILQGVAFEVERGGEVGLDEDGGGEESLLQSIKGILLRFSPFPGRSFPGEIVERVSETRVVTDEMTVETCKTKESVDVFEFSRSRPICDSP